MKVVVEGAIYDHDLDGSILVVDRNDWVNLAKLSRKFDISFTKKRTPNAIVTTFTLEAGLENLASELLSSASIAKNQGCFVTISFLLKHKKNDQITIEIQKSLEDIWGANRKIDQKQTTHPLMNENDAIEVENLIVIKFNRLIVEEQVDDLLEMIEYMIKSIEALESMRF